jgi:hypothetical protein
VSAERYTAGGRGTAAIERAYAEDVGFLDSEAELVGRQASSDGVQKSHANPEGSRPCSICQITALVTARLFAPGPTDKEVVT